MCKQDVEYNKIPIKESRLEKEIDIEERISPTPITTAVKVKQPLLKRMGKAIFGGSDEEGGSGFMNYLTHEIIIPSIQNIIVESVQNGIQMIVYGERRGPSGNRYYDNRSSYTNYQNAYRPKYNDRNSRVVREANLGFEMYEITNRDNAQTVRDTLLEIADSYNYASVGDYYDLINIKTNYTDNSFGWSYDTLCGVRILPIDGGRTYRLNLPRPERIPK